MSELINLTKTQKEIRLYLAKLANKGRYVAYSDLCRILKLPYSMGNPDHRNQLSEDLGNISWLEVEQYERPMLTAIVIDTNTGQPGNGFFKLAKDLYYFDDRVVFHAMEMNACYDFWQSVEGMNEIARFEKELY